MAIPTNSALQITRCPLFINKNATGYDFIFRISTIKKEVVNSNHQSPILLNVSIGHCPSSSAEVHGSPLRAQRYAAALLRMHTGYAESREWQVDVINGSQAATGGFKELIFEVKGWSARGCPSFRGRKLECRSPSSFSKALFQKLLYLDYEEPRE